MWNFDTKTCTHCTTPKEVCNSWIALHVHLGKKSSAFVRLLHDNRPKKKKEETDGQEKMFVCLFSFSSFVWKISPPNNQRTHDVQQKTFHCPCVCVPTRGLIFLYRFLSVDRICNIYNQHHHRFLCNDGRRGSGGDRFLFYTHKQIKFTAGYVRSKRKRKKN